MRTSTKVAAGFAALVFTVAACGSNDRPATSSSVAADVAARASEAALPSSSAPAGPAPVDPAPAQPPASPEPVAVEPVAAAVLRAADGGDGDSWRDTAGREYRLGMVNTPEYNECFGSAATAERKRLTAGGFRADVYAIDRYGRSVSVVTAADGTNLNVHLARNGYADDRYLAQFRSENPSLAADLEPAFAAAKAAGAGLWKACTSPAEVQRFATAPPPAEPAAPAPVAAPIAARTPAPASTCHPDYLTCIPVQGNGSGTGAANDLDCGDLRMPVRLRQVGVDPYRLDSNNDGDGCESYA